MPDPRVHVPTPTHLIGQAITRLGCRTHETRTRLDRATHTSTTIVTVDCPDEDTWFLLAALVEALGATLVRGHQVRGRKTREGLPLSFLMPAGAGQHLGLPTGD